MTVTIAEVRLWIVVDGVTTGENTRALRGRTAVDANWAVWPETLKWRRDHGMPVADSCLSDEDLDAMVFGRMRVATFGKTYYDASSVGDGPPPLRTRVTEMKVKWVRRYHVKEFEEYKLLRAVERL